MLTRRQKNSLRGFTAALSGCALLAAFLIFTNISNASEAEPVVFSEILDGAVAYRDDSELPTETLAAEELTETMFAEELSTFTLTLPPEYTLTEAQSSKKPSPEDTPIDLDEIGNNENTGTAAPAADESTPAPTAPSATFSHAYQGTVHGTGTEPPAVSSETGTIITLGTTETAASETTTSATTPATTTYITAATTTITTTVWTTTTTSASTSRTTTAATTATTTTTATSASTAATAATTAPVTTATDKTAFTNVGGGTFSNDISVYLTMYGLVNAARRDAGLKELWYSARLHEVCELRTSELTSYYSHTRPNGKKFSTAFKDIGVAYTVCGENIAYGRNMFSTPEEVFKAWMDSPSHRENILSPNYECVGFGLSILKVGSDTYYYWAQEFATLE